jgi:hypothetical protein
MDMNTELNIDQLAEIFNINIPNTEQIKKNEALFTRKKCKQSMYMPGVSRGE